MNDQLISIIVPVYQIAEHYLRASIESIMNQSYQKLEIILVDDGSPDSSGEICDFYAKVDKRIHVIHKENRGVSSARNCGISYSQGEYVMFVDSDDVLEPNAIDVLLQTALKTKSDIVISSCHHVKNILESQNSHSDGLNEKTVGQDQAIQYLTYNVSVFDELEPTAVWGKLYKRTILENLFFNEKMSIGEDFFFNYQAICVSDSITYVNCKLYNYRFVENSLMNRKKYSSRLISSFFELEKFIDSQKESIYIEDLISRSVNIAFTIYLKIPANKKEECKCIEDFIKKNRKKSLFSRRTSVKLKMAICISYISFYECTKSLSDNFQIIY